MDVSKDKLWEEIRASEKAAGDRLAVLKSLRDRYVSPFYKSESGVQDDGRTDYDPENHAYNTIKYRVPQVAFNAPRVRLNSRVYGVDQSVQELQYGVNQWVLDAHYDEFLQMPATDLQFAWCVTLTTRENHPTIKLEDGKPAKMVKKTRLSPYHYGRDLTAMTTDDARYEFHSYIVDIKDFAEKAKREGTEEGWNIQAIEGLVAGAGVEEYRKHHSDTATPEREEAVIYEIWVRDYEDDDHPGAEEGCHGTLFTLAVTDQAEDGGNAEEVRDARPFFGPPSGPYNAQWVHYVPDQPYGLSPLIAEEGQARDLNRHARGVSEMAARYKRLVLVDSTDPDFAEKIKIGEHDLVLPLEGLGKDKVLQVEIGGVTPEVLTYLQLAKDRLELTSGIGNSQKGVAQGGRTATAEAIADENSDISEDYHKLQFHRFVRRDLEKVLWYLWKDPDQRILLGPEAFREFGIQTAEDLAAQGVDPVTIQQAVESGEVVAPGATITFKGGDDRVEFAQLALEIEPMSMERSTEGMAQRRALELFQLVLQVGQAIPMMPYVRWDELLEKMGDALNVPDLADLIDLQAASAMAGMVPPQANAPASGKNPLEGRIAKMPGMQQAQPGGNGMPGQQNGAQMGGLAGRQ